MKTNKQTTNVEKKVANVELLSSELYELQARETIIREYEAERVRAEYAILLVKQDISSVIKTLVTKHGLDATKAYTVSEGMLVEVEEQTSQD